MIKKTHFLRHTKYFLISFHISYSKNKLKIKCDGDPPMLVFIYNVTSSNIKIIFFGVSIFSYFFLPSLRQRRDEKKWARLIIFFLSSHNYGKLPEKKKTKFNLGHQLALNLSRLMISSTHTL